MKSEQYFQYAVLKRFMLYIEMYHMQSGMLWKIREFLYSQNRWWSRINKQDVFLEFGAYFHTIKYDKLPISPLHTTGLTHHTSIFIITLM